MKSIKKTGRILEDVKINVKIKLAALWVALMFLYIYADIKSFFQQGIIEEIVAGEVAGILITPTLLWVTAILMSVPGVMVLLSLTLKPQANRWINIIVGILYCSCCHDNAYARLMGLFLYLLFWANRVSFIDCLVCMEMA